jgi:hypothetical protein
MHSSSRRALLGDLSVLIAGGLTPVAFACALQLILDSPIPLVLRGLRKRASRGCPRARKTPAGPTGESCPRAGKALPRFWHRGAVPSFFSAFSDWYQELRSQSSFSSSLRLRQWWASKRIGPMQWFLNLLEELEIECQIRAAEPRTRKRYRRDTERLRQLR